MVLLINNELYHHGILGQRWGKRNGPPYPLKASDHSASEKKAGWRKSLDKEKDLDTSKSSSYNSEKKKFQLTDKQKEFVGRAIGSAAVIGAAVYLQKSGLMLQIVSGLSDRTIDLGKASADSHGLEFSGTPVDGLFNPKEFSSDDFLSPTDDITQFPTIKDFPEKLTPEYLIHDLENVNPLNGQSNCVACAITEYFRSRGYDVAARSRDGNQLSENFLISEVGLLFNGFENQFHKVPANLNVMQSADRVRRDILKNGEGSSGIFAVNYSDDQIALMKTLDPSFKDTGHAISWRVMNGKVLFMDGQKSYSGDGYFEHLIATADPNKVFVGRLDNLEIDPTFIPLFMMPAKNTA